MQKRSSEENKEGVESTRNKTEGWCDSVLFRCKPSTEFIACRNLVGMLPIFLGFLVIGLLMQLFGYELLMDKLLHSYSYLHRNYLLTIGGGRVENGNVSVERRKFNKKERAHDATASDGEKNKKQ